MTSGFPVVSGREAIRVFERLGYRVVRQRGSHGRQYRIVGAASGTPIARVEVRIDGGQWLPATLDRSEEAAFAWQIWSLDWPTRVPASTTSHPVRSTWPELSNRRATMPALEEGAPTGRATGR